MIEKGLFKSLNFYCLLAFTLLFVFCLFIYPTSFTHKIEENGSYYFFSIILIVTVVFIFIKSSDEFNSLIYRNIGKFVLVLTLGGIGILNPKDFGLQNGHLTFLISCILLIILFSSVLTIRDCTCILIVFVFFSFIQIGISFVSYRQEILNIYAGKTGINPFLAVKGTFNNSGPFSCFLVGLLPFVFYISTRFKKKHAIVLYSIYISTVIFIIIITQSRTAVVALIVSQCSIVFFRYRPRISVFIKRFKYLVSIAFLSSLITLIYGLFKIKELSAYGRILSYAVLEDKLVANPFWGYGIGRLSFYYPYWQSNYFKEHPGINLPFMLSAGDTYRAYNEFLELYIESGVVGIFLFFTFIYQLFYSPIAEENKPIVNAAKAAILSVFSCCFTSYTFHCTAIVFILLLAIIILIKGKPVENTRRLYNCKVFNTSIAYCLRILILIYTCYSISQSIAVLKWDKLNYKRSTYTNSEKLKIFQSNYAKLNNNGKFLLNYGEFLLDNQRYVQAIRLIEESKCYFISYATFSSLALAYEYVNNDQRALDNYRFQSFYIPSRFYPKYNIMTLLIRLGREKEAIKVAEEILKMPIKVPSNDVDFIRERALSLLNDRN